MKSSLVLDTTVANTRDVDVVKSRLTVKTDVSLDRNSPSRFQQQLQREERLQSSSERSAERRRDDVRAERAESDNRNRSGRPDYLQQKSAVAGRQDHGDTAQQDRVEPRHADNDNRKSRYPEDSDHLSESRVAVSEEAQATSSVDEDNLDPFVPSADMVSNEGGDDSVLPLIIPDRQASLTVTELDHSLVAHSSVVESSASQNLSHERVDDGDLLAVTDADNQIDLSTLTAEVMTDADVSAVAGVIKANAATSSVAAVGGTEPLLDNGKFVTGGSVRSIPFTAAGMEQQGDGEVLLDRQSAESTSLAQTSINKPGAVQVPDGMTRAQAFSAGLTQSDAAQASMVEDVANAQGKTTAASLAASSAIDGHHYKAIAQNLSVTSGRPQIPVNVAFGRADWPQAIAEKTAAIASSKLQFADIQLDPPELGPLQVKVHMHHDQVSVSFSSTSPAVRDMLDLASYRLKDMFSEQGLNLVDVDVSDSGQQFTDDSNSSSASAGLSGEEAELANDISSQKVQIDNPWAVDYFA